MKLKKKIFSMHRPNRIKKVTAKFNNIPVLLVEGKEFNVDDTRALVDAGRFSEHAAVVEHRVALVMSVTS